MDDLIYKQSALDVLRDCYDTEVITYTNGNEYINYEQAVDLMELIPAQPEQRWIPVTERLPEKSGVYIVSGRGTVWECEFMSFGNIRGWANDVINPVVTAWRELPEPWEGEKE